MYELLCIYVGLISVYYKLFDFGGIYRIKWSFFIKNGRFKKLSLCEYFFIIIVEGALLNSISLIKEPRKRKETETEAELEVFTGSLVGV